MGMKSLYESILSSTNAGKVSLVRAWLEEYGFKNYTINDKGEIDVNGRVDLRFYDIETFPSYIQFGTVKGDFYWHDKIASLEGAPKKVGGNFYCSNNNLTSLKGAPKKVGRDFDCYYNKLTSLEGAPREVGRSFDCSLNNMTIIEGAPREVGRGFRCINNSTKFTEDDVKKVCKVKGKILV